MASLKFTYDYKLKKDYKFDDNSDNGRCIEEFQRKIYKIHCGDTFSLFIQA